jgi:hypothetical protein
MVQQNRILSNLYVLMEPDLPSEMDNFKFNEVNGQFSKQQLHVDYYKQATVKNLQRTTELAVQ